MSDFVQSLERGLSVITSFSAERPSQTLSDVARETGLTRATARRLLLTLVELGYIRTDGKHFELTARVLDIGYSFIASLNVQDIAQPYLEAFSERVRESSSVAVLDDTDIVYVARVPTARIMTVAIGLGSRFPAYQTSMGRVLLAELDNDTVIDLYRRSDRTRPTERTVGSATALVDHVAEVRRLGYALVDQELEIGVRSVAAPLRDGSGRCIAAVNVSTHAGRTSLDQVHDVFVPRLLETAADINVALARR
ncbi:MAG: IclR family transcriptional regulator C-terminal domain-containing protein [Actinomycetota bacterium]